MLLPGLLTEEELVPIREHQLAFKYHPETLPPDQRDYWGGPSQVLLDHPVVAGVLNEVLSNQGLADEDTYGFRFDHTGLQHRTKGGPGEEDQWRPHGGGGYFNFRQNSHIYQVRLWPPRRCGSVVGLRSRLLAPLCRWRRAACTAGSPASSGS